MARHVHSDSLLDQDWSSACRRYWTRSHSGERDELTIFLRRLLTCVPSQAAQEAILALGSSIPKPEFVSLDAGFEYFTRKGVALPEETVRCAAHLNLLAFILIEGLCVGR